MRDDAKRLNLRRIARFIRLVWQSPGLLSFAKSLVHDHVDELGGGVCDCRRCQEALSLIAKVEGGSDEVEGRVK